MHFKFGEYMPDRAHTTGPGLRWINNLVPNADGYDTIPGPENTPHDAAVAKVRGAFTGRSQSGADFIVYGTAVALYHAAGTDFTDRTRASGAYTLTDVNRWEFTQYGDYIVATNETDLPQLYEIGGVPSDFADANADASKAVVVATIGEFVVLGNIAGQGSNATAIGNAAAGVHWCAIGDPTDWPIVGSGDAVSKQSDFQILEGPGGDITNIVSCGEFALITREREIWRMDYVGAPAVFSFRKIDAQRGCHIPGSAITVGGNAYFPSRDGFLMCDGFNVKQIGYERVDNYYHEFINLKYKEMMSAAHIPNLKSVVWAMPSNTTTPTAIVGYNYALDRWWRAMANCDWVIKLLPLGESLDDAPYATADMDVVTPPDLGAVAIDELIGTDQEILAYFDSATRKLKTFTNESAHMQGEAETFDFTADEEATKRFLVRWFRPWYETDGSGTINLFILGRNNTTESTQSSLWTNKSLGAYGTIPARVAGRYVRVWFSTGGKIERFSGMDAAVSTMEGRR
jgi:hypothetical protein